MNYLKRNNVSKFQMISKKGQEFLERLEGRRNVAYKDSGGKLSIGVGHLITQSEASSGKIKILQALVRYSEGLTNYQVDELFKKDIAKHEGTVSLAVHASSYNAWEQHHIDALVCLSFNIGVNAFKNSTLAKFVGMGALANIPDQFLRWVYDNGVAVPGLVHRRKLESILFKDGVYSIGG